MCAVGESEGASPFAPPSGVQVELSQGAQHAVVVEVGGGLRTYRLGDWQILDGYGMQEMCSAARGQPLIPWPNRIRDGCYEFEGASHQLPLTEPGKQNAIHGLVRWSSWSIAEHDAAHVVMEAMLHPQPGYPFTLHLGIEYALAPVQPGLSVRTTATNVGERPCPYGAGAHPYLTVASDRIDGDVLSAPGGTCLETDHRGIPVTRRPVSETPYDFRYGRVIGDVQLDTAFTDLERDDEGRARVVLSSGDGLREIVVWLDATYQYLMLFTGDSLTQKPRRRRSVGVEPMTCAPNAFVSGDGVRVLRPGEQLTSEWGIEPRLSSG